MRFSTWFVRSDADDRMVEEIVRADKEERWPHGKYDIYAVDADIAMEEVQLQRDFCFRKHTRDAKFAHSQYQKYEAGLIKDIKHARGLTNLLQGLCDYLSKELGWLNPAKVRARKAYVLPPSHWN